MRLGIAPFAVNSFNEVESQMSWEDALRRMLPPTEGFQPHTTSLYGAIRKGGTSPHVGVDGNDKVGLNAHRKYVSKGDRVVSGQMVGTMGNMAVLEDGVKRGDHHLHYQVIDAAGRRLNPQEFWQQRELPIPSPPAYGAEHQTRRESCACDPSRRCAGSEKGAGRKIGSIRIQFG